MIDPPDIPGGGKVIGVGIDQIEVSRIRDSLDQHGSGFLDKIFTPAEQALLLGQVQPGSPLRRPLCRQGSRGQGIRDRTRQGVRVARCGSEPWACGRTHSGLQRKGKALLLEKGGSDALVSLTHLDEVASSMIILIQR